MTTRTNDSNVFWLDRADGQTYPPLSRDCTVDVAIIGAGMTGLHCALALRDSGLRVVVLEARRIGRQATGRSTAKVTSQHGLCYARLAKDFGGDHARLHAQENERALELVADLSAQIGARAAFERRDAFVWATDEDEARELEREAEAARAAGIEAVVERNAPVPVPELATLRFPRQAQFDPFGYLRGLSGLVSGSVDIHEDSRVTSVKTGESCQISVNGFTVLAKTAIVTTQMPIVGEGHFFAKAFPFAHPVAAAPLADGVEVNGMFINAGSPTRSLRTAMRDGRTYVIAAGDEFRPGEPEDERRAVGDLVDFLNRRFGIEEPTHLWTNEDFRPMDGAAFIGPADGRHPNLLVATGFAAWGITQGVVAGELLAALARGEHHPAASLYDATRHKPVAGGAEFLKENLKAGGHLVGDRLFNRKALPLDEIASGQGGVVSHDGEKLAVRRDASGATVVLSAICTHLGCVVDWNATDRTWDCPCHGSRFDESGAVLAGPATAPLEPRRFEDDVKADE
ncbi:MAG: FAD-dependent oxidoreductase [Rhizobiaceae bacterium]|nr:FAD-dependent oxidoreductase [Rhizobiaceae bacterium]MCV0406493.1 FAD-dependent oxidoreductase [Rhizobiaceae bacterium]